MLPKTSLVVTTSMALGVLISKTNFASITFKAHLMTGAVRHHRADLVGFAETERCIKSRLRDLIHLHMRGDPRGLPLGAGDCKGVSHENPFAQAGATDKGSSDGLSGL